MPCKWLCKSVQIVLLQIIYSPLMLGLVTSRISPLICCCIHYFVGFPQSCVVVKRILILKNRTSWIRSCEDLDILRNTFLLYIWPFNFKVHVIYCVSQIVLLPMIYSPFVLGLVTSRIWLLICCRLYSFVVFR